MEKQIKIFISGGVLQSVETNFDCQYQLIDEDNIKAGDNIPEPMYPDLIHDINKNIFE